PISVGAERRSARPPVGRPNPGRSAQPRSVGPTPVGPTVGLDPVAHNPGRGLRASHNPGRALRASDVLATPVGPARVQTYSRLRTKSPGELAFWTATSLLIVPAR